jgi:choline/ethanolamine kinase
MNTCHPYLEDIEAIQAHLESWKHLSPDQLKFERLGGLSNRIWKVSCPGSSIVPEAVIYRKFNQSQIVDRQKENHILRELAKTGVGSKFYAGTDEYRIEKYYESTELNPAELNTLPTRRHLAKAVSEIHSVELNGLDKKPVFLRQIEERNVIKMAEDKARKPELFTQEEKELLEEIMTLASKEEIEFLTSVCPKNSESVVFSHNDLHSANVLCLAKNQRLLLIDYEYSDYNFRAYDIANVFNESQFKYGHNQAPYYLVDTSRFPSDEDLEDFITYYLFFKKFNVSHAEGEALISEKTKLIEYLEQNDSREDFEHEVHQILEEVRAGMLFSHFYWTFWSIVMSKRPDIKFDYIIYAHKRFELYKEVKSKFFGRNQPAKKSTPNLCHSHSS